MKTRIALIFALAFAIRFGMVLGKGTWREIEMPETVQVAYSLAGGHGFANPFSEPTGPTAQQAPGWPFVLSLIFRLFGTACRGN